VQFNIQKVVFNYDLGKNLFVKERCGYDFEDAIDAIQSNKLLDIIQHQNKERYPDQWVFVIELANYVYSVPSVYNREKNEFFLKTMFPSRKLTKEYL
jgi:hypothetical protein